MAQTLTIPRTTASNRAGNSQQVELCTPLGRDRHGKLCHEATEIREDINRPPRRDLLTTVRLVLAGQRI